MRKHQQEQEYIKQQQSINSQPVIEVQRMLNQSQQDNPLQVDNKREPEQHKQSVDSQNQSAPMSCLICYLCEDIILCAVESVCGHAFCQQCLANYLLDHKECPICHKKIRGKKGAGNKRLDEFIQEFSQFVGGETADLLRVRKQQRRAKLEQRKIQNSSPGMQIDVRDDDFVWKKGRIVRTFNRVNEQRVRVKFLIIEYFENEKRQQFVPTSSRLAKAGYFTNRKKTHSSSNNILDKLYVMQNLGKPIKSNKRLNNQQYNAQPQNKQEQE